MHIDAIQPRASGTGKGKDSFLALAFKRRSSQHREKHDTDATEKTYKTQAD